MLYNSLFRNDFSEFDALDKFADAVRENITKSVKEIPCICSNIPMDKYTLEDGTLVFEIAATGISKDDFKANGKISSQIKDGNMFLVISYNKPKTDDVEDKKNYIGQKKIKHLDNFQYSEYIAAAFDISKLSANMSDGLLTIKIPTKEEVKPVEYSLD